MGSSVSTAKAEGVRNNNSNNTETINDISEEQLSPEELMVLQEIKGMPKYSQPETFEQKLYRKFSQEPLVPIGCLTTAYFLGSGIKSFYNRDAVRSQKMMRLRVGAQFMTLTFLMGYAGMSALNFNIAPGYHGNNKDEEKR